MRITIIADASYCSETGAAGYGYWLACERGRFGGDGKASEVCETSCAAEMGAITAALRDGLKGGTIQPGDRILFQTDCYGAIDAVLAKRTIRSEQEKLIAEWFKKTCKRFRLLIDFRHVKGHSGRKEARFVTNAICDRNARRNMREMRHSLRTNSLRRLLNED